MGAKKRNKRTKRDEKPWRRYRPMKKQKKTPTKEGGETMENELICGNTE